MAKKKQGDAFLEEQKAYRQVSQAEPLCLMVCVVRNALSEEAKVLEGFLSGIGVSPFDREALYQQISKRREALEAELFLPGAYDRVLAQARTLGLLTVPEVTQ